MQNDRRLFALLKPVKGWFSLTVLAGVLSGGMTIALAWLLTRVIDGVFLQQQSLAMVTPELVSILVIALLKTLFTWSGRVSGKAMTTRIKSRLRMQILSHLTKLGPQYVKGERSGELVHTLSDGLEKLDPWFSEYLPQMILAVVLPIIILMVVFPLDILSGVVFLVTAPLIPFFMMLIGQMAEKKTQRQWKILSWMSAHFLDVLQGLSTLKILGRSKAQVQSIRRITDEYRHATMGVLKIAFLSALVLELVGTISIAIIAVEVGLRLLYGKMAFQSALFILLLAPEYYQPLRELGARFHAGMSGVKAGQRLLEILESPLPVVGMVPAADCPDPLQIPVAFRHVHFQFPGSDVPAVRDISLTLTPGTVTALVGATGAGKSTVANLLLGFLHPTTGEITAGENPLSNIPPKKWRSAVAWVPQRPHLFYGTLRQNLMLARPDANPEAIDTAIRHAGLEGVIAELPRGLDTFLGEQGQGLSGGQVQRLAIARALLKDAPLLVLDEFTANLDVQTEAELLEALQLLQQNRTTLLIAHRLNTLRIADQVIVLNQGQIVQSGKPHELLQQSGPFAKLVTAYDGELQP
ncbi:MAG: thiol reductant ABC exporter subunit CydD [Candidatus Marinimicrobia bacterium]|nr:thiol reductant ABC exporter subunit CydD [Candidatus Neomarinimicrobiota bacterium]